MVLKKEIFSGELSDDEFFAFHLIMMLSYECFLHLSHLLLLNLKSDGIFLGLSVLNLLYPALFVF